MCYMIPYVVGKLAPNSSHFTRGLVKYVPDRAPDRGYFRAAPPQNGDKYVTSSPSPIVELVYNKVERSKFSFLRHCSLAQ